METEASTQATTSNSKRLIDRIESKITFFIDHREELYRAVTALAIGLNVIGLISMVRLVAVLDSVAGSLRVDGLPILYPLVTAPAAILFALIARRELKSLRPQGITAFAILLLLEILNGHVIIVLIGLYAIFNRSFREAHEANQPVWYQQLLSGF